MLAPSADFMDYLARLQSRLSPSQTDDLRALAQLLPRQRTGAYTDLGHAFIAGSMQLRQHYGDGVMSVINRLLIGTAACSLPDTVKGLNLTGDILDLYPGALRRLETSVMSDSADYHYPGEYYLKDLRFVTGLTVPCGAMVLDLQSIPGWKLLPCLANNPLRDVVRFGKLKSTAPWLRSHLELRYLDEFHEKGMETFYRRVTGLLRMRPETCGLLSASWFYDRKLEAISPHLGYLWKMPLANGAFILRGLTSQYDIASATARSRTRRQKYEERAYKPTCCLLIWPRDALFQWHDRQKAEAL